MPDTSKSQVPLKQAAEMAVSFATKAGAAEADALIESGSQYTVNVHGGGIEQLKQAQTRGLGLRVFVDHKLGFVYTSDLRPDALKDIAEKAVALAKKSQPDEFAGLPGQPPGMLANADALELFDPAVDSLSPEKKIAMAKDLEKAALAYDKRITRCDGCSLQTGIGETFFASSAGAPISYRATFIGMFVNPLADDGARQQSGNYGEFQRRIGLLGSPESIAKEAGRRAVERIGARGVPTQKVPVVLHPDIAGNWFQNMFNAFSGEQAFKKISYLTEKVGQPIASELVTIVDDGTMKAGVGTAPFDGDGLPTQKNLLVDKGVMKMFAYNAYWGRKAKVKSTGNAGRGYQNTPQIGSKNLYLAAGTSKLADIFKSVERGFYMVDQGAFGYNQTTGAYSYQAAGFWIENGAKAFPVQEITVASTTLEMLKNIVMVGDDLVFNGNVNSPTIKIAEMTVSGRESAG
ncbi:MAG: TldD/PmbA family protein [Candidatus Eiseniibacteriota bacterium]